MFVTWIRNLLFGEGRAVRQPSSCVSGSRSTEHGFEGSVAARPVERRPPVLGRQRRFVSKPVPRLVSGGRAAEPDLGASDGDDLISMAADVVLQTAARGSLQAREGTGGVPGAGKCSAHAGAVAVAAANGDECDAPSASAVDEDSTSSTCGDDDD
jgi:hypothetical protein